MITEAQKVAEGLSEAQRRALTGGRWNADPVCADLMLAGVVRRIPTVSWPYYAEVLLYKAYPSAFGGAK